MNEQFPIRSYAAQGQQPIEKILQWLSAQGQPMRDAAAAEQATPPWERYQDNPWMRAFLQLPNSPEAAARMERIQSSRAPEAITWGPGGTMAYLSTLNRARNDQGPDPLSLILGFGADLAALGGIKESPTLAVPRFGESVKNTMPGSVMPPTPETTDPFTQLARDLMSRGVRDNNPRTNMAARPSPYDPEAMGAGRVGEGELSGQAFTGEPFYRPMSAPGKTRHNREWSAGMNPFTPPAQQMFYRSNAWGPQGVLPGGNPYEPYRPTLSQIIESLMSGPTSQMGGAFGGNGMGVGKQNWYPPMGVNEPTNPDWPGPGPSTIPGYRGR